MNYLQRFEKLGAVLQERKLDALLVTHMPNIRYLCGFTGSSGVLLVYRDAATFFTDGRYTEQAKAEVEQARLKISKGNPLMATAKAAGAGRGRRLGFEAERLPVATWEQLGAAA